MTLSRRDFLIGASLLPFVRIPLPKAFASPKTTKENLYLLFNNLREIENGELREFTTIEYLEAWLKANGGANGSLAIATGLRSGTVSEPYNWPGELALHWRVGTPWNGKVTHPADARPITLSKQDPIVTGIFGVLHPETAHQLEINDPSLAGTVLWPFFEDETVRSGVGIGFHNGFTDIDKGMTNLLFQCSREARTGNFSPQKWLSKLSVFMPGLSDPAIWQNFTKTINGGVVENQWLPYIRQQGWPGAAIVIKGSMMNVALFHMTEVKNRICPSQPDYEIGKGTHPPFNVRYGREVRQFVEPPDAQWTAVGFLWDFEHPQMGAEMKSWEKISDVFGHDFHIHAFRNDGTRMGHAYFSMLGCGKLSVSLYPLSYKKNETAFFFNNDLRLLPDTLNQTASGLSVKILNDGENFVRDVKLTLSVDGDETKVDSLTIPLLKPHETFEIHFAGEVGKNTSSDRKLSLDPKGDFLQGGEGKKNDRILIDTQLNWKWI